MQVWVSPDWVGSLVMEDWQFIQVSPGCFWTSPERSSQPHKHSRAFLISPLPAEAFPMWMRLGHLLEKPIDVLRSWASCAAQVEHSAVSEPLPPQFSLPWSQDGSWREKGVSLSLTLRHTKSPEPTGWLPPWLSVTDYTSDQCVSLSKLRSLPHYPAILNR